MTASKYWLQMYPIPSSGMCFQKFVITPSIYKCLPIPPAGCASRDLLYIGYKCLPSLPQVCASRDLWMLYSPLHRSSSTGKPSTKCWQACWTVWRRMHGRRMYRRHRTGRRRGQPRDLTNKTRHLFDFNTNIENISVREILTWIE